MRMIGVSWQSLSRRALLNGTVLCATLAHQGKEFSRSVVRAEFEEYHASFDNETYTQYGIARYFATVELFKGRGEL